MQPALSLDEFRHLHERTGVEQTVDTTEAAALLGKKPQTLRRWACDGSGPIRPIRVKYPAKKDGKSKGPLRWSVAEIRALLAGNATATAA